MKNIALVLVVLAASGCSTAYLSSQGEKVKVVEAMNAKESKKFNRVAELTCEGKFNVDYCSNDLRNQAAHQGATLVRLISKESAYCGLDNLKKDAQKKCITVRAEALRPKNM